MDARSVKERELNYDRWQKFCGFLGAGLGGLLVTAGLGGYPFTGAPSVFRALFITLVLVSAVLLGRAYVGYTQSAHQLKVADLPGKEEVPSDNKDLAYPHGAYRCFLASLVLGGLAAAALLIAVWWSVF